MPDPESYIDKAKGLFSRISEEEAETLLDHLSRAWRSEELIPRSEGYIMIPLDRIEPPDDPLREELGDLEGLGRSIRRRNLLQPIAVRPLDHEWRRFEPIVGLRRYMALRELGRKRVPAYVLEVNGREIPEIALEENRFRKRLEPPELLGAMLELRERGYSLKRIAEMSRKSRSDVSTYLKIPDLPREVREAFFRGEISIRHVDILSKLDDQNRRELFDRILKEGMSVDDARSIAKLMGDKLKVPDFFDREEFESLLGRRINYRSGSRGTTLTIKVEDEEELGEILRQILK